MTDETWLNPKNSVDENEVAFDYIKSNDFRVVWADGGIGGMTPNGLIHVALYAERPAIPRRQVHKLNMTGENVGTLGPEVVEKQISRGSIVRDMACDVMMTPQGALNLANFLLSVLKESGVLPEEKK